LQFRDSAVPGEEIRGNSALQHSRRESMPAHPAPMLRC
jgi:hypothetical protein